MRSPSGAVALYKPSRLVRGEEGKFIPAAYERKRGRPLGYDRALYRARNVVERLTGHAKEYRRIGTRHEKRAVSYRAMVQLAFIECYLRLLESPDGA